MVQRLQVYGHRDGSRSYVGRPWHYCDDETKKLGTSIVIDTNNDGYPERRIVTYGCDPGKGYTNEFETDLDSDFPIPNPVNLRKFDNNREK